MTGLPTLKWNGFEIAFWLVPIAAFFLFPRYLTLGSQILITALFALSNRMAHLTALQPNPEFFLMGRTAAPRSS